MSEINPLLTGKRADAARAWADVEWAEIASFLGPNADRFPKSWLATRQKGLDNGGGIAISWSWPAFVFSFAWFWYRRMWAIGAVLLVIPLTLGFILPGRAGAPAVGIVTAMYAKSLLLQHGVTRIAQVKAAGGGYDEIAAAGGVSVAGGVIGGAILALIVGGIILAAVVAGPGALGR